MESPILKVAVRSEPDVVLARHRARQVAALLGFEAQDQTRIATAVSEIARNAFQYAGGGQVEFSFVGDGARTLRIRVTDGGKGIPRLRDVLDGRFQSSTGMGLGILGARRLMDGFHVDSAEGQGTTVELEKRLPKGTEPPSPARLAAELERLARESPGSPLDELREQNQELVRITECLRDRMEEVERLNLELEETNRGVVALYSELDEKAEYLQRASELKSSFLSNMSHEFRTPVNSILNLTRLLLDRLDGDLTVEQEKQVSLIRRSAEQLSELVNDLLDLAKIEAGKITVRPAPFSVPDLFGALRGMFRPLVTTESVALLLEDPADFPSLYTDEGKLSQILRNFISNALKFTEQGEVRVRAELLDGCRIGFSVEDTGIGIAPEDQERIFEEFIQVEGPVQKRVHGTGLGLPLSRRLAELLGGRVELRSEPGKGSTFTVIVPRVLPGVETDAAELLPEARNA